MLDDYEDDALIVFDELINHLCKGLVLGATLSKLTSLTPKISKRPRISLNHCPFCGTQDWEPVSDAEPQNNYVYCRKCGASGPKGENETEAIKRFKTRIMPKIKRRKRRKKNKGDAERKKA